VNVALHSEIERHIQRAGFSFREVDWLLTLHDLISTNERPLNYFDLLAAALKRPQLFSQRPEIINGNVERSVALLGLAKEQFAAAALRWPSLFYQKPETLDGNVKRSAALLGLAKEQFTAAALRQPSLFGQKPKTLNGNIERSAALLGLTKTQFIAAALRQPSLFYQKPETLNGNVKRSAALLGLAKEQFVAAALRQPSLFYQKPETLSGKLPYLLKINEVLDEASCVASLLEIVPTVVAYGRNHLHARYVLAKLGLKRGAVSSLVVLSSRAASTLILDHFTLQIERTGKGRRALQVMHAQGLIATLPSGLATIQRPPKRTASLSPRQAARAGAAP
jgi:hypothetical protein